MVLFILLSLSLDCLGQLLLILRMQSSECFQMTRSNYATRHSLQLLHYRRLNFQYTQPMRDGALFYSVFSCNFGLCEACINFRFEEQSFFERVDCASFSVASIAEFFSVFLSDLFDITNDFVPTEV